MIFKPNVQKPAASTEKAGKKKLGGQIGHLGAGRKLPQKADQVERVFFHH